MSGISLQPPDSSIYPYGRNGKPSAVCSAPTFHARQAEAGEPDGIGGYGPVKGRSAVLARARLEELLAAFDQAAMAVTLAAQGIVRLIGHR